MEPLRRTIQTELRVLDEPKGIVEYVASDQTLDRGGEVILASGWRFTQFQRNAPFVDCHDHTTVEKCLGKVIDFAVKGERLVETVQWVKDRQVSRALKASRQDNFLRVLERTLHGMRISP